MRGQLLSLLFFISGGALAECTGGEIGGDVTFDMGTHYVPRDAPIGSVIGTANVSYSYQHPSILCAYTDYWEVSSSWPKVTGISLPPITGLDADGATILKTNVPGVGLVVFAPLSSRAGWVLFWGVYPYPDFRLINVSSSSISISDPIVTKFTLIKISDDVPMGSSSIKNTTSAVRFSSGGRYFHSVFVTGAVIRSECSLAGGANTYIEVPMGNVMRRGFNGKNSYTDSQDVVIPLINCVAGSYPNNQGWNFYQNSNAHIRLEGVQGSKIVDAAQGVLGLTQESTAKGVAIQVLRKDGVTPLALGRDVQIARLNGTSMNIELKARYIQTSDSAAGPEPGKAEARAAFTVTYK